jgi:RNA polymerase sigma-70 factor (ECF subfamily)
MIIVYGKGPFMLSSEDFEHLYEKHYPAVYNTCLARFKNADFAKEITQEAFSRAFMKYEDLRDKHKFRTWVAKIAVRYGYNQSRLDLQRFNQLPPEDLLERNWTAVSPEDLPVDETNFIRNWILTLKEVDQSMFLMKHYYYITDDEIGFEIGKPASTVKRRLALLRSKLKAALEEERKRSE